MAVIRRLSAPRSWLCPANFWVVSMTCSVMCQRIHTSCQGEPGPPVNPAWLGQACHVCLTSLGMPHSCLVHMLTRSLFRMFLRPSWCKPGIEPDHRSPRKGVLAHCARGLQH